MSDTITTVSALEAIIGKTPGSMNLKVIDHLDEGALHWISKAPLIFAAFGSTSSIGITLCGGAPGFAGGDNLEFRLPTAMIDDPSLARPGLGFGSVVLLPGVSETMRVNGKVAAVRDDEIVVAVEECFFHCGKSLIRSEFWGASRIVTAPGEPATLVSASRFMALATVDAQGRADVSPKGDQAGAMANLEAGRVWFADRPGNKRIDSFRNIITQPRVAAALVIPGSTHVASLCGVARITTNEVMRTRFVVRDKVPALVTCIDELAIEIHHSSALVRANLWPVRPAQDIEPVKIMVGHIKLNKSLAAKVIGTVMSVPGLLQKGLDQDYKKNLY